MPPPPAAADAARLRAQCDDLVARIRKAERPAILLGSGIRVGHAEAELERVIRKLQIPVTTSWTAIDLLGSDDPLYCGRPGSVGDRPGNFTIQNSDLVITLGSRLPIRQVSYNFAAFAHHAFKVQVDIDPAELEKPYGKPDLGIVADLREFLIALDANLGAAQPDPRHAKWLAWCKERLARYPVVLPKHSAPAKMINPYHFSKVIFEHLEADDVVACGDGTASVVPFQASPIKLGQRLFTNAGSASMGYDLPAAIGAAVARGGKRAICFAGDGSLQLNLQELQTVVHNKLAIKIFVFNNGGYVSIRQSQKNFFGRLVGEGPESGISFPDIVEVARAYGIPGVRVFGPDFMPQILPLLSAPGPAVFDVMLDPNHIFEPKVASKQLPDGRMVSAPLEDMGPFLDREELLENMLVPPLDY
jgi:acetolactate synthase-1/2/3 large subunit